MALEASSPSADVKTRSLSKVSQQASQTWIQKPQVNSFIACFCQEPSCQQPDRAQHLQDTARNDFTVYWALWLCSRCWRRHWRWNKMRPTQPWGGRWAHKQIPRVTGRVGVLTQPHGQCVWVILTTKSNSFNSDTSFTSGWHTTPRSWPALPFRLENCLLFFWPCWHGTLALRPGTEPVSLVLEMQSLNCWTPREVLSSILTHLSLLPGWNV